MKRRVTVLAFATACLAIGLVAVAHKAQERPHLTAATISATPPRGVVITGYSHDAMEPFISRDGRYLLFNNLNQPGTNTDIHYAERQNDLTWVYRGKVAGINTPDLEGCASLDAAGRLYFVSPRHYAETLCTIYSGQFKDGVVTHLQMLDSISRKEPGIVNFDVDVSPDGKLLVFVDSRFKPGAGPQSADLVLAQWDGAKFVRCPDSGRILENVNADALQYAPTISADKRTLYFTRFDSHSPYKGPQIYRTQRATSDGPFGPPEHLGGLGDYVEGSCFSPNERLLYFHRKDGAKFSVYTTALP